MEQGNDGIAVIINTPSYERVSFALGLASAQQAMSRHVRVLFAYGAIIRLTKDRADRVGEETGAWTRREIAAALEDGSISTVTDLLHDFRKLGGKVYACPAAMSLYHIERGELINEVDAVRGVVSFLTEQRSPGEQIIYV